MELISKNPDAIRLFLSGDIMLGRGVDQILKHSVDPTLSEDYVKDAREYVKLTIAKNGPLPENRPVDYVWGDALKILKNFNPDIKVANLNTAVTTNHEQWSMKGIHYRMHPKNVEVLQAANLDCVVLANAHILDYNYKGLEETIDTLKNANIITIGAGRINEKAEKPAIFQFKHNHRIMIYAVGHASAGIRPSWKATASRAGVNYLSSLHDSPEIETLIANIRYKKQKGDIVILSIHWGSNWNFELEPGQRKFAHRLIDEGLVDLIYGHGSHHIKGIEIYKEKLIIYGAGSFINDAEGINNDEKMYGDFRDDVSFMYFPELDPNTGNLLNLYLVPMRLKNFQVKLATEEEDLYYLFNAMERECEKFNLGLEIEDVGQYFKLKF